MGLSCHSIARRQCKKGFRPVTINKNKYIVIWMAAKKSEILNRM